MKLRRILLSLSLFVLISSNTNMYPQTFGFGCLGFVGGYGGVVYQSYKADGLNQYVKYFNEMHSGTINDPFQEFYGALGYRVGINFFRASWESGFMITAKGYYQSLSRTRKTSETLAAGSTNYLLELELKNWSVGIDVGFEITRFISWKIIDGAVQFNNVSLINTINSPGSTQVSEYKNDSGVLGYSIGTGLIIDIIDNYISIEGLAGYSDFKIGKLTLESGHSFLDGVPGMVNKNFIESGGFNAVVQLNLSFPL